MSKSLSPVFEQAAQSQLRGAPPSTDAKPFSIRLTDEERAYLKHKAGRRPLGAYCREILLAGHTSKARRKQRSPKLEDGQYAALLASLGSSRMSSNLNQLTKHANMGTLDISEDTEAQLREAYGAVLEMRKALFMALGLKCGIDIQSSGS